MNRFGAAAILLIGLCAGGSAAAPAGELVREEAFNYKIAGKLPAGWVRRENELVWVFSIDKIPHAYVHLLRQRLASKIDAGAELKRRAQNYRFPGMPEADQGTFKRALWGNDVVATLALESKHKGVACRRIVRARCAGAAWYEQIETIYAAADENDARCAQGLAVFRRGFRLLAPPVSKADLTATDAKEIEDGETGYTLNKPAGFRRLAVDPGKERGIRIAFRAEATDRRRFALVRLFEYGRYPRFAAQQWLNSFFTGFATEHESATRHKETAPAIQGAKEVHATLFKGRRDQSPRQVRVILCRTESGRVFVLRITTSHGAENDFRKQIQALVGSLRLH